MRLDRQTGFRSQSKLLYGTNKGFMLGAIGATEELKQRSNVRFAL